MDEEAIKTLFKEMISRRDAGKLTGLARNTVGWHRTNETTLGKMLELLYKAGKITVTANEPEGRTKQNKAGNT